MPRASGLAFSWPGTFAPLPPIPLTLELAAAAVRRIWKAHGLQPYRYRQFKLSNDPNFVDKLRDLVGLYVDPPAHAIVLSLDEKIQAPSRTCR